MPKFSYHAKDQEGRTQRGIVTAPTEQVAADMMRERELIVLRLAEVTSVPFSLRLRGLAHRVSTKDLVMFSRQMAVLISATVPIVRALNILARQSSSQYLRDVLRHIADDVDGGARLSTALRRYPHIFDDFFVYMVRAGETTGRLDEVLAYLADQKEKDYELTSRILVGLIYPFFIVLVLAAMFVVMMMFVMPKLLDVLVATGAPLPVMTRILLGTSTFFQNFWWLLLTGIVVAVASFVYARTLPVGHAIFDRVKLQIPILGGIFLKIALTRIARSMANLLSSGVPINRSLQIVADVVENEYFKAVLKKAEHDVESGVTLSESLRTHALIPPMMVQMMAVGEETGRLDHILLKLAEFYTQEVNSLTRALVSLIEPIIIILLGIAVTVVLTGILLPIYAVTASL